MMMMTLRHLRFATALAVLGLFLPGPVRAGTPLISEDPLFGGGFVPPSAALRKGTQKVGDNAIKYARSLVKCYRRSAAFLAAGVPDQFQDCASRVRLRYDAKASNLASASTLPACLNQASLGDGVQSFISGTSAFVFCDDTSLQPLPVYMGVGYVPGTPIIRKVESAAAKNATRLGIDYSRCFRKAIKKLSRGDSIALFPICIQKAESRYARSSAKLTQKFPIPGCLALPPLGTAVSAFVTGLNPLVYCASPSGAFLDGADVF